MKNLDLSFADPQSADKQLPPPLSGIAERAGTFAPFRHGLYAAMWIASVASSFGMVVHMMAAAWLMMKLSSSTTMVAMVQTAATLPSMLLSLFAGALSDIFGRRRQMLASQIFGLFAAAVLAFLAYRQISTPTTILLFTLLLGIANVLFMPAWQSSVSDIVPARAVPAAVGLGAVGMNMARCIGPAIGGVILLSYGATGAFLFNAITYIGLIGVLLFWRRQTTAPSREPILASMRSGILYIRHDPAMLGNVVRCFLFAFGAVPIAAFLPLIARDLLGGGLSSYSSALTAYGLGAMAGGLSMASLRRHLSAHRMIAICYLGSATASVIAGLNISMALTELCLFMAGAVWVLGLTTFNISMRMLSPAWLVGRAVASYQSALFAGLALGSTFWGLLSAQIGVAQTISIAGCATLLTYLIIERVMAPVVDRDINDQTPWKIEAKSGLQDIPPDSGPIITEIHYQIDPARIDEFLSAARALGAYRRRHGVRRWMIRQDVDDSGHWIESYWSLNQGERALRISRLTNEGQQLHLQMASFQVPDVARSVRHYVVEPETGGSS